MLLTTAERGTGGDHVKKGRIVVVYFWLSKVHGQRNVTALLASLGIYISSFATLRLLRSLKAWLVDDHQPYFDNL